MVLKCYYRCESRAEQWWSDRKKLGCQCNVLAFYYCKSDVYTVCWVKFKIKWYRISQKQQSVYCIVHIKNKKKNHDFNGVVAVFVVVKFHLNKSNNLIFYSSFNFSCLHFIRICAEEFFTRILACILFLFFIPLSDWSED